MNTIDLNNVSLLCCPITINKLNEINDYVEIYLRTIRYRTSSLNEARCLVITTPNPEQIVYLNSNYWFNKFLNKSQINIPDGIGVVKAMQLIHNIKINRISGIDFIDELCKLLNNFGSEMGLIGGMNNVALDAIKRLENKYPNINYFNIGFPLINDQELTKMIEIIENINNKAINGSSNIFQIIEGIIETIIKEKIKVILVGLGSPKQELVIALLEKRLNELNNPVVLMSVGGSFDFISGRIKKSTYIYTKNWS